MDELKFEPLFDMIRQLFEVFFVLLGEYDGLDPRPLTCQYFFLYATDWKYYPMAIAILIIAFPVIKYYLPFFRRLKVTTAYEYLEKRFDSGGR